jgi:hypothetical protein
VLEVVLALGLSFELVGGEDVLGEESITCCSLREERVEVVRASWSWRCGMRAVSLWRRWSYSVRVAVRTEVAMAEGCTNIFERFLLLSIEGRLLCSKGYLKREDLALFVHVSPIHAVYAPYSSLPAAPPSNTHLLVIHSPFSKRAKTIIH